MATSADILAELTKRGVSGLETTPPSSFAFAEDDPVFSQFGVAGADNAANPQTWLDQSMNTVWNAGILGYDPYAPGAGDILVGTPTWQELTNAAGQSIYLPTKTLANDDGTSQEAWSYATPDGGWETGLNFDNMVVGAGTPLAVDGLTAYKDPGLPNEGVTPTDIENYYAWKQALSDAGAFTDGVNYYLPESSDVVLPQLTGTWGDGGVFETYLMMMLPAIAGMVAPATAASTAGGSGLTAPASSTLGGGSSLANAAAPTFASTTPTLTAAATVPGLAAPTAATFGTGTAGLSSLVADALSPENLLKSAGKSAATQLATTGDINPESLVAGAITGGLTSGVGQYVGGEASNLGLPSWLSTGVGSSSAGALGSLITGSDPLLGATLGAVGGTANSVLGPNLGGLVTSGIASSLLAPTASGYSNQQRVLQELKNRGVKI